MDAPSFKTVSLTEFATNFGTETELSSVALGGKVLDVSDDFFAEATNLLKVQPAESLKGQFGPKGALYDGWESRRHNPAHDWCIIQLGAPGFISGFDIDTANFNGNEAPEASVQALCGDKDEIPPSTDKKWKEILPRVALGPNSRHIFEIHLTSEAYTHVKLNMYPDGGIARFRVYGIVKPTFPIGIDLVDLAHVVSGGRAVFTSDQHFGVGSNLLLPGRGKDMGDGWETKRSRTTGHKDWVIIRLGEPGYLQQIEIDTAHFKGNFPESCEVHVINDKDVIPAASEERWTLALPRTKLGPHRQHFFQLENVQNAVYTHVKATIYPDGGIKRVRVLGRRIQGGEDDEHDHLSSPLVNGADVQLEKLTAINGHTVNGHGHKANGITNGVSPPAPSILRGPPVITAVPLTPEAFAPYGKVVQAWGDVHAAPRGVKVTEANQGSAVKFHKQALLCSSYPPELAGQATAGLSVYRCQPLDVDAKVAASTGWDVKLLERHPYTNQAFIPMGVGVGLSQDALSVPGRAYLVVVANNGMQDKPDLRTLRAFVANAGQGVVYRTAVWHHPMIALERTMDFTCVETQIGNGGQEDCEIVELDGAEGYTKVQIPVF